MTPETIIEALLLIWDDLPALLKPADWRALVRQLEPALAAFEQAQSPGERASRATDLLRPFPHYPAARDHLRRVLSEVQQDRSAAGPEVKPPLLSRLVETFHRRLHPTSVTRYTDVAAPRRVPVGERSTITVGLTVAPECESLAKEELEVRTGSSVEVALHPLTDGVEVLGDAVRQLPVHRGGNTPPVAFHFKATKMAPQRLLLDFRQGGVKIGDVRLGVEVVADVPADEEKQAVLGPAVGPRHGPAIDLDMQVALDDAGGKTYLIYLLHSPSGVVDFRHTRIRSRAFACPPDEARAQLMSKIEKLHAGFDVDDAQLLAEEREDRLAAIGHDLYRQLFPSEMRAAYRRFRDAVKTIQITSEEPWIPWELVKPYDDTDLNAIIDDDFLAGQFQLTRWLSADPKEPADCIVDRRMPADRIRVQQLACIEAGEPPQVTALPHAAAERELLAALARSHPGVTDASPEQATYAEVMKLLKNGRLGLLHVAGHGDFDAEQADDAGILLVDNRSIRPRDLHGRIATQVKRDRPLVFLNACRGAQLGWSWTGLGGWAERWVAVCGCGAFVGPLWAVSDDLAYEFARAFYRALERGETFGQAALTARQQVRAASADGPTWLAFTVYAHPNGWLLLEPNAAEGSVPTSTV